MNDRNRRRSPRARYFAATEAPRALSDFASLVAAAPYLSFSPRSRDGHTVVVLPGLGGGDGSTAVIRGFLTRLGYRAQPWRLGTNLGPRTPELADDLPEVLHGAFADAGERPVSLVGWSLGGVYARVLAHRFPDEVRQVITLGSPFGGNVRRAVQVMRQRPDGSVGAQFTQPLRHLAAQPLQDIPTTAIFSKSDGVVPWRVATEPPAPLTENIEVYASHLGLGVHPGVLYAVADRLATPEDDWRPFVRRGWKSVVYGPARIERPDAASLAAAGVA